MNWKLIFCIIVEVILSVILLNKIVGVIKHSKMKIMINKLFQYFCIRLLTFDECGGLKIAKLFSRKLSVSNNIGYVVEPLTNIIIAKYDNIGNMVIMRRLYILSENNLDKYFINGELSEEKLIEDKNLNFYFSDETHTATLYLGDNEYDPSTYFPYYVFGLNKLYKFLKTLYNITRMKRAYIDLYATDYSNYEKVMMEVLKDKLKQKVEDSKEDESNE